MRFRHILPGLIFIVLGMLFMAGGGAMKLIELAYRHRFVTLVGNTDAGSTSGPWYDLPPSDRWSLSADAARQAGEFQSKAKMYGDNWIILFGGGLLAFVAGGVIIFLSRNDGKATAETSSSTALRICSGCGTQNPKDVRFCGQCGRAFIPGPPPPPNTSTPQAASASAPSPDRARQASFGIGLGLTALVAWIIPLIGLPVAIAGLVYSSRGLSSSRRGVAIAGLLLSLAGVLASIVNGAIGAYQGYHAAAPRPDVTKSGSSPGGSTSTKAAVEADREQLEWELNWGEAALKVSELKKRIEGYEKGQVKDFLIQRRFDTLDDGRGVYEAAISGGYFRRCVIVADQEDVKGYSPLTSFSLRVKSMGELPVAMQDKYGNPMRKEFVEHFKVDGPTDLSKLQAELITLENKASEIQKQEPAKLRK